MYPIRLLAVGTMASATACAAASQRTADGPSRTAAELRAELDS